MTWQRVVGSVVVAVGLSLVPTEEPQLRIRLRGQTASGLCQGGYTPPVGIPCPPAATLEVYTRYVGDTFAAGGFAYRDDGYNAYSHFVDSTDGACTNTANVYGTAAVPRCALPAMPLDAGAVVIIRNGSYAGLTITSNGTSDDPVFVMGWDDGSRPVLTSDVTTAGDYLILDYLDITDGRLFTNAGSDYTTFKNGAVHGAVGSGAHMRFSGTNGLYYNNQVHSTSPASGAEIHGVSAFSGSENLWILDNDIYDIRTDSIQFCHTCVGGGNGPLNVYIGGNTLSATNNLANAENGIDIKEYRGVLVVSENHIYDFADTASGNGECIRVNDEGTHGSFWIINNNLHDCQTGILPQNADSAIGGELWIIGNRVWDVVGNGIGDDSPYVVNNTVYGAATCIVGDTARTLEITNNIVSNCSTAHISGASPGVCSHNLAYQGGAATSVDADCGNTLTSDPLLTSPTTGNMAIPTGSPAKDSGTTSSSDVYGDFLATYGAVIATDYAGTSRPANTLWDRGAFEFVAPPAPAPSPALPALLAYLRTLGRP